MESKLVGQERESIRAFNQLKDEAELFRSDFKLRLNIFLKFFTLYKT